MLFLNTRIALQESFSILIINIIHKIKIAARSAAVWNEGMSTELDDESRSQLLQTETAPSGSSICYGQYKSLAVGHVVSAGRCQSTIHAVRTVGGPHVTQHVRGGQISPHTPGQR